MLGASLGDEPDFEADEAGRAMTIPESSEAATLSDSTPPWEADVEDDADEEGVTLLSSVQRGGGGGGMDEGVVCDVTLEDDVSC